MNTPSAASVVAFAQRNLAHDIINTAFHDEGHTVPDPQAAGERHPVPGPGTPSTGALDSLSKKALDSLAARYPDLVGSLANAEGVAGRDLSAAMAKKLAAEVARVAPDGKLTDAKIQKIADPRIRGLVWTASRYAMNNSAPEATDFDAIVSLRRLAEGFAAESICPPDDRRSSNDSFIGRASSQAGRPGCSITMISDTVGVTAGHCLGSLNVVEFNVPESTRSGQTRAADPKDQYPIDPDSIRGVGAGPGDDWAVFRTLPNAITGLQAGAAAAQASGRSFYVPSFRTPQLRDTVQITGYGRDDGRDNFTQQAHEGPVVEVRGNRMRYTADTEPGNSGSTVRTGRGFNSIIGVHTHGGCSSVGNQGTLMTHPAFRAAVEAALADEARELGRA
ncbi:MAG: trypsin-like serine protease [Myxococcota bacterium]